MGKCIKLFQAKPNISIFIYSLTALFISTSPCFSEISNGGAKNIGTVLAAGVLCEKYKHIKRGQTIPLMNFLQRNIEESNWSRVNEGYQRGLKERVLYSKNHDVWVDYDLNRTFCTEDIQFALDAYNQRAFPKKLK